MSSRLMPPKVGSIAAITSTSLSGSRSLSSMSKTSMPANFLNRQALPSITGLAASGPMAPSPSTAVPLVTTPTRLLRDVSVAACPGSATMASHAAATPGEYASARSRWLVSPLVGTTEILPGVGRRWYSSAAALRSFSMRSPLPMPAVAGAPTETAHCMRAAGAAPSWRTAASERARIRPAVEQQVLAGDEAGVGAAQEGAGVAEFGRVAEAAGGIGVHARAAHLLVGLAARLGARHERGLQAIGVERPGQQVVDGDVVLHGLARQSGDEAGEPRARTVGQPENVDGRLHRTRGDVHDTPEAARDHAIHRRLDELDRGQHVGIERPDPVLARPVAEIARRRTAGVGDEDVRREALSQDRGPAL